MKKLFVPLLLLAAVGASAQERDSVKLAAMKFPFGSQSWICSHTLSMAHRSTSISLVAGPNWHFAHERYFEGGSREPRVGHLIGIDFARQLTSDHWQLKMGFRYNVWKSDYKSEFLVWPSEFSTGTYVFDPTLPHQIEKQITEKAWQYFAGLRWFPRQPMGWHRWCWYTDVEIGTADVRSNDFGRNVVRFTAGLGAGVQWNPGRHISLFAQPGARYVFSGDLDFLTVFPLHLEAGARWEW